MEWHWGDRANQIDGHWWQLALGHDSRDAFLIEVLLLDERLRWPKSVAGFRGGEAELLNWGEVQIPPLVLASMQAEARRLAPYWPEPNSEDWPGALAQWRKAARGYLGI
jgi:hypothetical protein